MSLCLTLPPLAHADAHNRTSHDKCKRDECSLQTLVQTVRHRNTIVATFTNTRQAHFTTNWVHHLRAANVKPLLVGVMNVRLKDAKYAALASQLRAHDVGVYTVNSPHVRKNPQGGRWFHVLPLLSTGVRLILSDSDAVWMRDPIPYFIALERRHPTLDVAVSSDAQGGTDGGVFDLARPRGASPEANVFADQADRRKKKHGSHGGRRHTPSRALRRRHRRAAKRAAAARADIEPMQVELDLEEAGQCWQSLNIGIMAFPPGGRAGSLRLMQEAERHLSEPGNLARVDQGPLNYRWKTGSSSWKWARGLTGERDDAGKRLCSLVNGTVMGGVLPTAQFGNTLTHSVLQLGRAEGVDPYVVHATYMRSQKESFKVSRLREARLWRDAPAWYSSPADGAAVDGSSPVAASGGLGPSSPAAGYMTFDLVVPRALLDVPRISRGALPHHHLQLMQHQLAQLRSAFFLARTLGRALVLPPTRCSCELGFWPTHIEENCIAGDHESLRLPYQCAIDHYLDVSTLDKSPFAHRERTFFENPRTPVAGLRESKATVVRCADGDACAPVDGKIYAKLNMSQSEIRSALGATTARVLHVTDVLGTFGRFDDEQTARTWHDEMQDLLSSWCCTSEPAFKRTGGLVPYLLPPLEGQTAWRGREQLAWAGRAIAESFRSRVG